MALRPYLEKIKQGISINYDAFLHQLPAELKEEHQYYFQKKLTQTTPKKWKVTCNNKDVFLNLWELSEKPKNRIDAAIKGNSHDYAVSSNILLVYHQKITDLRPDIVYISDEEIIQTFTSKPILLLLENEENFLQYVHSLRTISLFLDRKLSISNTDIVFGSGNKATAGRLIHWYNSYDEILCAFDYDAGGLSMFKTLHKHLGNKVKFVQPKSYEQIRHLFQKLPNPEAKLLKAINLANQLGYKQLSLTFSKTRRFMEQEVLLKDFE